jgi:hypothetical protein
MFCVISLCQLNTITVSDSRAFPLSVPSQIFIMQAEDIRTQPETQPIVSDTTFTALPIGPRLTPNLAEQLMEVRH